MAAAAAALAPNRISTTIESVNGSSCDANTVRSAIDDTQKMLRNRQVGYSV